MPRFGRVAITEDDMWANRLTLFSLVLAFSTAVTPATNDGNHFAGILLE